MTIPGTSCHPSSGTVILSGLTFATGGGRPALPDSTLEAGKPVPRRRGGPGRRGRRLIGADGTRHEVSSRHALGQPGRGGAAGGRGAERGSGLPALVGRGRPGRPRRLP